MSPLAPSLIASCREVSERGSTPSHTYVYRNNNDIFLYWMHCENDIWCVVPWHFMCCATKFHLLCNAIWCDVQMMLNALYNKKSCAVQWDLMRVAILFDSLRNDIQCAMIYNERYVFYIWCVVYIWYMMCCAMTFHVMSNYLMLYALIFEALHKCESI